MTKIMRLFLLAPFPILAHGYGMEVAAYFIFLYLLPLAAGLLITRKGLRVNFLRQCIAVYVFSIVVAVTLSDMPGAVTVSLLFPYILVVFAIFNRWKTHAK